MSASWRGVHNSWSRHSIPASPLLIESTSQNALSCYLCIFPEIPVLATWCSFLPVILLAGDGGWWHLGPWRRPLALSLHSIINGIFYSLVAHTGTQSILILQVLTWFREAVIRGIDFRVRQLRAWNKTIPSLASCVASGRRQQPSLPVLLQMGTTRTLTSRDCCED